MIFPSTSPTPSKKFGKKYKNERWRAVVWLGLLGFLTLAIFLWPQSRTPAIWVWGRHILSRPALIVDPIAKDKPFTAEFTSIKEAQSYDENQTLRAINRFVPGQGLKAEWKVDEYDLHFTITVEDGKTSTITAKVYIPRIEDEDNSDEGFPFIVYGPGSTGLDDRCAPSREDPRNPDLGNYPNQMIAQASQGFVVVMPNYEGLDNLDRIHVYFNAELEARTMLGAAEVALSQTEVALPLANKKVFFGGYSQGGHAAFAAADKAELYTPDMEIGGIYGHGPTTDITDFLLMNPNLAPYFVFSYDAYYPEVESSRILSDRALKRLSRASTLCVDEAFQYNSTSGAATYTPEFWAMLSSEDPDTALKEQYPELAGIFSANDAGTSYVEYPTLFLQGTGDPIVTAEAQQVIINKLCARGVPVSLKTYPNLHHWWTRQNSFKETNDWIRAVSSGRSVDTECN